MDDVYLPKLDLAKYAGTSKRTIERLIHDRVFPVYYLGRKALVKRSDFDAFMESSKIKPVSVDVRERLKLIADRALAKTELK